MIITIIIPILAAYSILRTFRILFIVCDIYLYTMYGV